MRAILGSPGVLADLMERGAAVAAAAQAQYDARPPHQGEVEVTVEPNLGTPGAPRARVAVIARHPAALHIEADRRPLGSALDAARQP